MAKSYLIVTCLIFTCLTDAYVNICYNMLDGSGEKVNIMVNRKLPFFPEDVEILTETVENTYVAPVIKHKTATYRLRKSAVSCDDPFIYAVPWSDLPLQTIKFSVIHNLEALLIDEFKTAIRPNFTENLFKMDGLLGNVKMRVVLIHQTYSKLRPLERSRQPVMYDFTNTEVRKLKNGEIYCMEFLTTDFSNILSFSSEKYLNSQPWKYHLFTISFYKSGISLNVEKKRYLTEISPCQIFDFMQRKLKIIVDPKIIMLKFEIAARSHCSHFKNIYSIKNGQFNLAKGFGYLEFNELELIQQPLSRDMVHRREYMLIYFLTRTIKLCSVRLPENFDSLGLSNVDIRTTEIGIVHMNGYYVDFSSEKYYVFNIKPGKPNETDICRMELT